MKNIKLIAAPCYIPLPSFRSGQVLELLIEGISREKLAYRVKNYRGSPLENLEGEKYGYWLVDRCTDEQGSHYLKLNYRHLSGDPKLDKEARTIRRKERAHKCLNKNRNEIRRERAVLFEMNEAQKEYFLSLGDSANDSKKPTEN